jgi:hypothetical protein
MFEVYNKTQCITILYYEINLLLLYPVHSASRGRYGPGNCAAHRPGTGRLSAGILSLNFYPIYTIIQDELGSIPPLAIRIPGATI